MKEFVLINPPPIIERGHIPQDYKPISPLDIPPIPQGVTINKVYGRILQCLFNHIHTFFKENTVDGKQI